MENGTWEEGEWKKRLNETSEFIIQRYVLKSNAVQFEIVGQGKRDRKILHLCELRMQIKVPSPSKDWDHRLTDAPDITSTCFRSFFRGATDQIFVAAAGLPIR